MNVSLQYELFPFVVDQIMRTMERKRVRPGFPPTESFTTLKSTMTDGSIDSLVLIVTKHVGSVKDIVQVLAAVNVTTCAHTIHVIRKGTQKYMPYTGAGRHELWKTAIPPPRLLSPSAKALQ